MPGSPDKKQFDNKGGSLTEQSIIAALKNSAWFTFNSVYAIRSRGVKVASTPQELQDFTAQASYLAVGSPAFKNFVDCLFKNCADPRMYGNIKKIKDLSFLSEAQKDELRSLLEIAPHIELSNINIDGLTSVAHCLVAPPKLRKAVIDHRIKIRPDIHEEHEKRIKFYVYILSILAKKFNK